MNQTLRIPDKLKRIFEPSPRAVVGLVDDLLELCPVGGMELDWHADCCRVRYGAELVEIPLPKAVFAR